jgi:hypothetical protein
MLLAVGKLAENEHENNYINKAQKRNITHHFMPC